MKKALLTEALNFATRYNNKICHDFSRHFTFIIQNGKIVEWGLNRISPAPKFLGYKDFQMIHSELDAYKKAKGILDRTKTFELINIRLDKRNGIKISKPCPCCFNFLKTIKCRRVYYTNDKQEFEEMRLI